MTLAASSSSAAVGTSITLTATVGTSGFGNPPAGEVEFTVNGMHLGRAHLIGGTDPTTGVSLATATLITSKLPVGADTVMASYKGDRNYVGSSSSVAVTVTPTP